MLDLKTQKAHIVKADRKLVDWLMSLNSNNRNIRKSHVMWLENSINNNEFILTGHGITISKEGILLDGQHRLQAIVNAGYPPVELLIITGLEKRSQMYIDQHAKRSLGDMLRLTLNKNITSQMTAVLTFLFKIKETDTGFQKAHGKPSIKAVHDMMDDIMGELLPIVEACGGKLRAACIAAIFHYQQKHDRDAAISFALQVRDGEMLKKGDPAYVLRKYVTDNASHSGSQSIETYRHAVTACIAHSQGRPIEQFRPTNSWGEVGKEYRMKPNGKSKKKKSAK